MTLENKEKCVIHYRNFEQCTENGLKLITIHGIIKFNQPDWLGFYLSENKRQKLF